MTHTFAVLDVSPACFEEVKERLAAVGYTHCLSESGGKPVLDMHGLALRRETDERVKVYIMLDGKVLKPPALTDRPAAKSSTSVLQASVCQSCGCPLDGEVSSMKPGCECRCHI